MRSLLRILYRIFLNKYKSIYYKITQKRYKTIVQKIQKKDKIKIAFLLIFESVWKYDRLYKLLELDARFEPVIVICPYTAYDEETLFGFLNTAYETFKAKGYRVVNSYNNATNKWLDVKHEINPDVVFFTSPYNITKQQYLITNFLKTLSCYVPYTFQTTYHLEQNYNGFFHNVLWRAYYPTVIHYKMAARVGLNKGINGVLTGYPVIDRFLDYSSTKHDDHKSNLKKHIIWAPHHTIEGNGFGYDLHFSNFIRYHYFMKEMAIKYKESLFITFKPHPLLKVKLSNNKIWGTAKTEKYFSFWKCNNFCALNLGNYESLFEDSDAMIHDCDSFMGEYLSLNKPVLYTRHDDHVLNRMNEFGKAAYQMHYQAGNEAEILHFIEEVVIKGNDSMKDQRTKWIHDVICPPNNREASMNIYLDLKNSLGIKE